MINWILWFCSLKFVLHFLPYSKHQFHWMKRERWIFKNWHGCRSLMYFNPDLKTVKDGPAAFHPSQWIWMFLLQCWEPMKAHWHDPLAQATMAADWGEPLESRNVRPAWEHLKTLSQNKNNQSRWLFVRKATLMFMLQLDKNTQVSDWSKQSWWYFLSVRGLYSLIKLLELL